MLERSTARIAAFTNAPRAHAEHVFEALNIQGIFDPVFTIEDSGYLGKPHPDAYDGVLGRLEAPPARITMIEDTRRFLAPAKARGMRTVLINGTGHDPADPDGIDAIVESIHDLPKAAPWLFAEE
jgi:putative hydrolase of the HAD superfamily